ncbi:MAG: 3-phosphoshikimate 1-carboxyvinyltransferase [Endomicrobium sp.]|jgi:3-phosphoshikimate 1-carboxyvinyltransferase|nr:3-phosphoshikimate 1-carboxyvinyltransferase [Endomicrobium sp.]
MIKTKKNNTICGVIEVPGDKSITHRSIMLSALANGTSIIRNYLLSDDCNRTIEAFRKMGVKIKVDKNDLCVDGLGLKLGDPVCKKYNIYAGNSGTTARLISGILAWQNFETIISGDDSLSVRPMQRIIDPLLKMGVNIKSNNGLLPLVINGRKLLKSINYKSEKSTAQVKSAVLFAGLHADGPTTYSEPIKSRDHSERMLKSFGANINVNGNSITVYPLDELIAQDIVIPGDISSAAFFIAAALIVPKSDLVIKNVGINPTRNGFIDVLKQMKANINLINVREISNEPVCDIAIKYSKLKSTNIDSSIVPRMIDEIPVFALVASQADGVTKISGAEELRTKETDRINAVVSQFKKLGIQIESSDDGFLINGSASEEGLLTSNNTILDSFKDHRIAMTLSIASLITKHEVTINDSDCVNISFPSFYKILKSICTQS